MEITPEILRTDEVIRISSNAIIDKVIGDFNKFIKQPNVQSHKIRFEYIFLKRDNEIHIKYPGTNGLQEEVIKK